MMLLRIGKRSTVVLGKYLATVIASVVSILATLVTCIVSYYLFAASSAMGTGTFASTMEGLSSLAVCGMIGLQILMYLLLIGVAFFVGLFANPFITFVLTMVVMSWICVLHIYLDSVYYCNDFGGFSETGCKMRIYIYEKFYVCINDRQSSYARISPGQFGLACPGKWRKM